MSQQEYDHTTVKEEYEKSGKSVFFKHHGKFLICVKEPSWAMYYQYSCNEVSSVEVGTPVIKSSTDYLNECITVQEERGAQYETAGGPERSFSAVAIAFNAITGKELKGSDICLVLQVLKDVRQYSDQTRLHEDSVLDKVSYASLHAEELNKELL